MADGFIYPRYNSQKYGFYSNRFLCQCKNCRYERNNQYKLGGIVELDDACFGSSDEGKKTSKRNQ